MPLAPALMVIHASLLVAAHAQPVEAVTATVPVLVADVTFADAGEMVGVQGAAACVIANEMPPIVSVAVRAVVPELAVTL